MVESSYRVRPSSIGRRKPGELVDPGKIGEYGNLANGASDTN